MLSLFLNAGRLLKAIVRSWGDPQFHGGLMLSVGILLSRTAFYGSVEGWHWVLAARMRVSL